MPKMKSSTSWCVAGNQATNNYNKQVVPKYSPYIVYSVKSGGQYFSKDVINQSPPWL